MSAARKQRPQEALHEPAPKSSRRPKARQRQAPARPIVLTWDQCKGPEGMALIRRAKAGDEAVASAIVAANEAFIRNACHRYTHRRPWLKDDLLQEARAGFHRAMMDKFDPDHGVELTTYVGWWVLHAAQRFLADHSRTIRVPVHAVERLNKAIRAGATTVDEARALGGDPAAQAWPHRAGSLSLDVQIAGDEGDTFAASLADEEGASPEASAGATETGAIVKRALLCLTPREREVVGSRYLDQGRRGDETLKEIGDRYGLSRERIRQIEGVALRKLRTALMRLGHAGLEQELGAP